MNAVEGNITLLQGNVSTLHNEMNAVEGNITLLQGNVSTLLSNIDQPVKTSSNVTFNNLTITDEVTINGNLIVRGNKTIVDSVEHVIRDTLITLNSKGLSDPIGIEGNTSNGNIIKFVFDQTNNYWHTDEKSIKANIIGDISGRTGNLNNLNMFGNINLNNNWINDISGILFADGTILTSNQISSIGGTGSNVDLNSYADVSFGNMDIIGKSKFQVNGTPTKDFQVGCQYRFDTVGEFWGPAFFKNAFVIQGGRPEFVAGLTITSQIMEVKQQASIGIHTLNPQKALDVNTESIFRDIITAKNKINLTGNLSIEKSITYNWNNYGEDLSGDLSNDQFGSSVAINNIGNIIAVGAPLSNINGTHSGLVRIYENINTVWRQIGQDLSGITTEQFGYSLSINSIGNIIAVGAPHNNINGADSGVVRIYNYNGSSWQQIGNDLSGVTGDNFGYSLSINSIGDKIIVGAPHNNINGADSGVARIYKNISNSWSQMGVDISGNAGDKFGFSVSIDGTGDIIAIGGPFHSSNNYGYYQYDGIVKIFNYVASSWQQKGGNYITGDGNNDKSGYSVSLSKDGSRVAIGAPYNDGNGSDSGNVRIYYFASGWWIKLGNSINGDLYIANNGLSVSLNNDGSRVIMGEPNSINGAPIGMIKIYQYDSITNLDWIELGQKIYGKMAEDDFGYSVGINGIGDKIIVGAPLRNISDKGEVNIYELETNYHNSNIDVSGGATFSSDVIINGIINLPNNFSIQTVGSSSGFRNVGNNGFSTLKQIFFTYNNTDIFAVTENGDLQHKGTYLGTQTTTYSDDRLKHNEINITNGLEVIRLLQPQKYQKTRIMLDKEYNGDLNDYEWFWEAGFVAQDILTINDISYSISGGDYYDASNNLIEDPYRLNYNNIFTYTTTAVKELDVIVQAQQTEINDLKTENTLLKSKLNEILSEMGKETI